MKAKYILSVLLVWIFMSGCSLNFNSIVLDDQSEIVFTPQVNINKPDSEPVDKSLKEKVTDKLEDVRKRILD